MITASGRSLQEVLAFFKGFNVMWSHICEQDKSGFGVLYQRLALLSSTV